jgi:hypothetical protein
MGYQQQQEGCGLPTVGYANMLLSFGRMVAVVLME